MHTLFIAFLVPFLACAHSDHDRSGVTPESPAAPGPQGATSELAHQAAAAGELRFRLSDRAELLDILGPPLREETSRDGGMHVLTLYWQGVEATLGFMGNQERPYTLRHLPAGFDPAALLEAGRNPGLGMRALHARGINGQGVGLAIIDQPLLPDHVEYSARLDHHESMDVDGVGPQMHGPSVASIAVGQTVGVAPGASLTYYAVPMWTWDSAAYADLLDHILAQNARLPPGQQVRVVSISTGMFSQRDGWAAWQAALQRAQDAGLFVITCDVEHGLDYGTLTLTPGADPDLATGWERGPDGRDSATLLVPAGGRTLASEKGPDAYRWDPEGGMSWGAPWIAGLAALGLQVAPEVTPAAILQALVETALPTAAGPVVNPAGFVERMAAGAL